MANDGMKPVDVGGIQLIPTEDSKANGANFGGMLAALNDAKKVWINSTSSLHPDFTPGFDCLKGTSHEKNWQGTTIH